jgi:chemotaxis protein histidine kinase CheA
MSDLAETLWREFAAETEEHFEIIEPLLVAAETQTVVAADIAQLFRSFHSVKGLARSMDMKGMEEVSHHAENVLGLVREGTTALDAGLIALLLNAVDVLKGLREAAVTQRISAPVPEGVIEPLEAAFAARSKASGPSSTTVVTAASVGSSSDGAVLAPQEQPCDVPLAPGLDADMLRYYAEMVREHLPAIARCATAELADASVRDAAVEAIDTLLHATEVMEFLGLAVSLASLRACLGQEPVEDTKRLVIETLGRIRSDFELIERESSAEIAGQGLADRLGGALQAEVNLIVESMLEVLGRFSADPARAIASDEALAEELAILSRSACTFFVFLNLHQSSRLLLMVEDVFTRVAHHEMHVYPELLALTREVSGLLTNISEGMGRWRDLEARVADDILDRFRQAVLVSSKTTEGVDPVSALKRVLGDYDIRPELVEILSAENIQELVAAVRGGRTHLYEISAYLEGSEQLTLAFVNWVKSETTAITNRTVFIDGKTWFEFLVVSNLEANAVASRIAALDPVGECVRMRSCQAREVPEGAATPSVAGGASRTGRASGGESARTMGSVGKGGNVLRVRGETIDQLMAQIGEMVTISNMMHTTARTGTIETALNGLRSMISKTGHDEAVQHLQAIEQAWLAFLRVDEQLGTAVAHLQDATMELRVVAIDTLFNRFPRVVRDIAQATGKQVKLETTGAEVRIDKGMVDLLLDPLMHMVRNAVDHGIESPEHRRKVGKPAIATLHLTAVSRGNRVEIQIADDGGGMDVARIRRKAVERGLVGAAEAERLSDDDVINFIFAPGFSTADQVSETSGRGVGMDVVRTNVLRMGGLISVETRPGKGSTFLLQLPLSAAIQRVLMVEAAGKVLAIPERFLSEIYEVDSDTYQLVRGRPAILLRDKYLPLFRLSDLLGFTRVGENVSPFTHRPMVVLARGRQRIGIEVERLHRRQELFVREIHPQLAAIPGVGGASISGDGKVVLIVDGDDLFSLAENAAAQGASVH